MNEVEKIKKLVADTFSLDPTVLSETANFFTDLGADSLLMLSFISSLEREFDVEISDDVFDDFYCIENIMQFLESARQLQR